MKIVMDTQIRLTTFSNSLKKEKFTDTIDKDKYIELNDKTIFLWDYPGILDNELVFNSYITVDGIYILIDSETQMYRAYRKGILFEHAIFKEIAKWIKIKYDEDYRRLLSRMKKYRYDLINHNLKYTHYIGIHSDTFSVTLNNKEILLRTWNKNDDKKLLGIEENFSFFLKSCKVIL